LMSTTRRARCGCSAWRKWNSKSRRRLFILGLFVTVVIISLDRHPKLGGETCLAIDAIKHGKS